MTRFEQASPTRGGNARTRALAAGMAIAALPLIGGGAIVPGILKGQAEQAAIARQNRANANQAMEEYFASQEVGGFSDLAVSGQAICRVMRGDAATDVARLFPESKKTGCTGQSGALVQGDIRSVDGLSALSAGQVNDSLATIREKYGGHAGVSCSPQECIDQSIPRVTTLFMEDSSGNTMRVTFEQADEARISGSTPDIVRNIAREALTAVQPV